MKISRLERIYCTALLVIFAGIVVHAPLSVWLGTIFPDYSLLVKSWKEIIMLGCIPLAIAVAARRKLWGEFVHDRLFYFIVAYALLHIVVTAALYKGAAATAAGLAIDLRYVLFFGLVYIAIRALPQYRLSFLKVGIAGAFVVAVFGTLQFFLPPDILTFIGYSKDTIAPYITIDQNADYVRINSTLRGPNPLGAYAGIVLGLLTAAWVRGKITIQNKKMLVAACLLAICSFAILWLSYSRGALLAAVVILGIVFAATILRKLSRRAWIVCCVVMLALAGGLFAVRETDFVSNVILHENTSGGSRISSNDEHVRSLEDGINRMLHQPFGAGVGSTGSASIQGDATVIIENHYLFVAHETGWLGLVLFVAIFCFVLVRLWKNRQDWVSLGVFASGVGLAFIGLFLPVWADDTVSIIWWGLAAIALAGGSNGRKQAKQKTT